MPDYLPELRCARGPARRRAERTDGDSAVAEFVHVQAADGWVRLLAHFAVASGIAIVSAVVASELAFGVVLQLGEQGKAWNGQSDGSGEGQGTFI